MLPADNSGSNFLDKVLGFASGAADIYAKVNQSKVQNLQAKADIPSSVAPSTGGFQLDQKTLLIGGAVVVALIAVPLIISAVRR